ncbi:type IA DNA topoisomerase [Fusobacterium gastrosuis]|uniref:type IA DNA topoisomerase n=1 Tax=Fusobacterium gastrosuis TaxID=1755100 RepID=UPI002975380C|nr:DNA topoisomerase [Fusobacteriaceae bacterium]MDY5714089.1 DNA topoisomerase [Fusobacterium gastrosuis]
MKKLIICEKPSLAQNIATALNIKNRKDGYLEDDKYIVSWAFGHLYELKDIKDYPGYENFKWQDLNDPFIPKFEYKVKDDPGVKKQIKVLKELMKKDIESIINCGDADREGQLIIDNIINNCGYKGKVERLWLPEQTSETIREQIKNTEDNINFFHLNQEGMARTLMDWLLGVNLTVYLSNKTGVTLRVGRVLIPILKFIYDREIEIRNFIPKKYYVIENESVIKLTCKEKYNLKEETKNKIEKLNQNKAVIKSINEKDLKKQAKKLFSLSTLQSELSKKYKIPFKISLDVIQKLYEDGFLTYPRTNTEYLADNEKIKIKSVINAIKSNGNYKDIDFKDSKSIFDSSKIESHSAITPTIKIPALNSLKDIEKKVYETVLNRFLANFCNEDCIISEREMIINVGEEIFSLKGKTVKKEGFLKYESEEFNDRLPNLSVGDKFDIEFKTIEKETQKPKRITESNLSKYLKNPLKKFKDEDIDKENEDDSEEYEQILSGIEIGTEATRTGIIENAKKYGYISQEKSNYKLEPLGEKVIETLDKLRINLYAEKTVEFSKILKEVYNGDKNIKDVINLTENELNKIFRNNTTIEKIERNTREIYGVCPKCGGEIYAGEKNYYCNQYKNGCNFSLFKKIKIYGQKEVEITDSKVKMLLEGKSILISKVPSKTGKEYDAYFKLEIGDKYNNLIFDKFKDTKKK